MGITVNQNIDTKMSLSTSCGTLIVNKDRQLLLCHVTNTEKWDIPKGLQEPGESTLEAAVRELHEETGLKFDETLFQEIGCFDYHRNKRLHLYRLHAADDFDNLDHLVCTSHFSHRVTGTATPEVDAYCWASRADIENLCWPRMAQRLLSLEW
jgi:putative (di)nucleoside polyphosphate hydrolase